MLPVVLLRLLWIQLLMLPLGLLPFQLLLLLLLLMHSDWWSAGATVQIWTIENPS
jgi:hypothetical protein